MKESILEYPRVCRHWLTFKSRMNCGFLKKSPANAGVSFSSDVDQCPITDIRNAGGEDGVEPVFTALRAAVKPRYYQGDIMSAAPWRIGANRL